jgi:four helix bundle protein
MAQSYQNLHIWKDAIELAFRLYVITKKFPKDEQFGLVSQLRRAGVSISSNIAEGSSRKSKKDYIRFIDIAIGSLNEVESILHISQKIGLISEPECDTMQTSIQKLGNSLGAFRKFLQK